MPIAKVRSAAETYIPPELLQVRTVLPGDKFILTQTASGPGSVLLSHSEKVALRQRAATVTLHLRQLLGLNRYERLEHIWPKNYHEFDPERREIAAAGEHTLQPMVRGTDGKIREEDMIWIDDNRRHKEFLTEDDIIFTGRIAIESDRLGGGWVINRGPNPNNIPYMTPRDKMLAAEQERSKIMQLPTSPVPDASPLSAGVAAEQPQAA